MKSKKEKKYKAINWRFCREEHLTLIRSFKEGKRKKKYP